MSYQRTLPLEILITKGKIDRDFPEFLFGFWDGPQEPDRQCLEGAKPPKACTRCLLPKNVSQIHYTLTALEHFDLQAVMNVC